MYIPHFFIGFDITLKKEVGKEKEVHWLFTALPGNAVLFLLLVWVENKGEHVNYWESTSCFCYSTQLGRGFVNSHLAYWKIL